MTDSGCPSWMSQSDFLRCRTDPYRALDAAQRYIASCRSHIRSLSASQRAASAHPALQLGRQKEQFERLRAEHLSLASAFSEVCRERGALLDIADTLRRKKRESLIALNAARRALSVAHVEFDAVVSQRRRQSGRSAAHTARLAGQESQLAALDQHARDAQQRLDGARNELHVLAAALRGLETESRGLESLRAHLDATAAAQTDAVAVQREAVRTRQAEAAAAHEALWSYKTEMTPRLLAAQRLGAERAEACDRLTRLAQHEMDTLAAQNAALTQELRRTAEALLRARTEGRTFGEKARRELADLAADAQRYAGVVQLVEEQNKGVRGAIERAEQQLQLVAQQTSEKDHINSKNVIEQSNMVSLVQMDLVAALEDLRLARAQLCSDCRDRIVSPADAEEDNPDWDSAHSKKNGEALAHPQALRGITGHGTATTDAGNGDGHVAPKGSNQLVPFASPNTEAEGAVEVERLREALDALNRQLLSERAMREEERRDESNETARRLADAEAARSAAEQRKQLEQRDEAKQTAGEAAVTYTVQLADGTRCRVDAFPSDTVEAMVARVALRLGITQQTLPFHLAEIIDEGGATTPVRRFLNKHKSLEAEGIAPHSSICFAFKHYKRPQRWSDPVAQEWFYRQLQQCVVQEYFPITEAIAVRLASYQLQTAFGDYSAKKRLLYFDQVGLDAYLPACVSAHEYDYWQERLALSHKKRLAMSASQARGGYVDLLSTTPCWGMTFFEVRDRDNRPFLAGVAEDGLFIFSSNKQDRLDAIPFPELMGWERCPSGVVVRRRSANKMTLYTMSPLQAKEMIDLLDEYYMLLPISVREELCIDVRNAEVVRAGLMNPTLFEFPVVNRPPQTLYTSRAEYLKAAYMSYCAELDEQGRQRAPAMTLVRAMDQAIDNETEMTALDLTESDPPVDDRHFGVITDILEYTLREYQPSNLADGEPWLENVKISSILLTQPTASRQLLTAASVPMIIQLVALFPFLKVLDASFVPIDSAAEKLGAEVVNCKNLEHLTLKGCRLGARALQSILLVFGTESVSTLRCLNLEENFLTHAAIHSLCDIIRRGRTSLVELNLASNRIEAVGIDALVKAVTASPNLTNLDVSGNPGVASPSSRAIALASKGTGLQKLCLRSSDLHFVQFMSLDTELQSNKDITHVDLSDNPIGEGIDAPTVRNAFQCLHSHKNDTRIGELRLVGCALQETELADALGAALVANNTLQTLCLQDNRLAGRTGFLSPHIVDALGKHPSLRVVDVSNNGMSYAGAMRLFVAIIRSDTITEFRLDANHIGDAPTSEDAFVELLTLLESSASLQILSVCGCGLREEALVKIGEGLSRNRALHHLAASGNDFTVNGIVAFSRLIKENDTLKILDLSNDAIRENETVYVDTFRLLSSAGQMDTVLL